MDNVEGIISPLYAWAITMGVVMGTIARAITLVVDYRQTPTYPDGQFIHLIAGFVAAALGAVAIPALLEKNYAAFTFLALGVQHFRDIRKIEKESLERLELTGYARRGDAYIDGISKTYEARNYISMITAIITCAVVLLLGDFSRWLALAVGVIAGTATVFALKWFTRSRRVGDIAFVRQTDIRMEGSNLFVEDIFVTSTLGSPEAGELMLHQGLAVVITPKQHQFSTALVNAGQRQAILYEAAGALGVKNHPYVVRSLNPELLVIAIVPIDNDVGRMIAAIQSTPLLENSRKVQRIMSK